MNKAAMIEFMNHLDEDALARAINSMGETVVSTEKVSDSLDKALAPTEQLSLRS